MKITESQIDLADYTQVNDPWRRVFYLVWFFLFLVFLGAVVSSNFGADLGVVLVIGFSFFPLAWFVFWLRRHLPRRCPEGGKSMIRVAPERRPGRYTRYYRQVCEDHMVVIVTDLWSRGDGA